MIRDTSLRRKAIELDRVLAKYEQSFPDAAALRHALGDLIKQAERGELTEPIKDNPLPGGRLFEDGTLGTLIDLANAYGKFAVELRGGPPPALQQFLRSQGYDPVTGDKLPS